MTTLSDSPRTVQGDTTDERRVRAETLYGLARAVIHAEALEQVFEPVLDALERALATRRSAILTVEPDGAWRCAASRGLSDRYRRAIERHSSWPRGSSVSAPILVEDVRRDRAWAQHWSLFQAEQVGALGVIPLLDRGRLVGELMVHYERPRALAPAELEMALVIADHVSAASRRFTMLADLQRRARHGELLTGILSHDLRNPLTAIMNTADVLLARAEPHGVVEPAARIKASGTRMSRMIDQIFDFTRVRTGGGLPLERGPLDVVPLLRRIMDEIEVANSGWTLRLEPRGNGDGAWDANRLSQVFSNLIANAVQHGVREHGVTVRLDGTSDTSVRVEVHNMGMIEPASIPFLFEPMGGSNHGSHRTRGLGLGLFIAREIVRAHGGNIEVGSKGLGDTMFVVLLPRRVVEP